MSAATATAPTHRERLIAAMAESVEEKGYRETFVGDVVRIARTSRRSFYENFADRDACFLALFDWATDEVMTQVADAVAPEAPWEEQVDDALGAWLGAMVTRPALWQSFTRELPALGQEAADRQRATQERFADLLVGMVESGRRKQPQLGAHPLTKDIAIIIVGGLRELVITASERGRDVRELRPVAARAIMAILGATVLEETQ
ncbi:MAG: TetR/AcrR family transcriptional regulator [Solirubrobacteraceae bacterium]